MQNQLLPEAEGYARTNVRRRIWRRFVRVMACIVVFCTTYALILPAITMEKTQCQLEEHVHGESCYEKVAAEAAVLALSCTYESLGVHVHTADCYDADQNILCGQADYLLHVHGASCMDASGNIICQIPERTGHVHTEACYMVVGPETELSHIHDDSCYVTEPGELICQLTQTEGHTHGEACYIQGELLCQLEEQEAHVHGAECSETVLVCTLEVEPHIHNDGCYTQLVCEIPEGEAHTHTEECSGLVLNCELVEQPHEHVESCYETHSLCELAETEDHAHEAACYESLLVCERPEEEPHAHAEDCYELIPVLICGLEENSAEETEETQEPVLELVCTEPVAQPHVHGESCYVVVEEGEEPLTCGLPEDENHTHSDVCYGVWTLICGKEEHTHDLRCKSNPEADVESETAWMASFANAELTGQWAQDVVAIAQTQVGYTESTRNYMVLDDDVTTKGYTRYGAWYGDPYGDWCAMFASFCLNYAGLKDMPVDSNCPKWIEALTNLGLYYSAEAFMPRSGDLVFFDWDEDGLSDHVGIVEEITADDEGKNTLHTIEGNSGDRVAEHEYAMDDETILGYFALPEQPVVEETNPTEPVEENAETQGNVVTVIQQIDISDQEIAPMAVTEKDYQVVPTLIEGTDLTWAVIREDDGTYTLRFDKDPNSNTGNCAIPDYSSSTQGERPWIAYKSDANLRRIEIGEGVTRIGVFAFHSFKPGNSTFVLSIGRDVAEIGDYAFAYANVSIQTIPGNVKTIGDHAFAYSGVSNPVIEEGVETIKAHAFTAGSDCKVSLPNSVEFVAGCAFRGVAEYEVNPDHPHLAVLDGVLYSKDMTILLDYPKYKVAKVYTTPTTVTTINTEALVGVLRTPELYITGNVQDLPYRCQFGSGGVPSNWEKIVIDDDVPIRLDWSFYNNPYLRYVELPENYDTVYVSAVLSCPSLETVTITKNVKTVSSVGYLNFQCVPPHLVYDAANASISANDLFRESTERFDLEIGLNVDNLPKKFYQFVQHADSVKFQGENHFTVEAGVFASWSYPLTDLSGTIFVDAQGVVYSYDADAEFPSATVVYVQPGVTSVTIPATITADDGTVCTVTTVKKDSLIDAELTSIEFASPENITVLEDHAMANCPTLTSVNGKTTLEDAEALFINVKENMGYLPFFNTGLGGAPGTGSFEANMDGSKALTVTREGASQMDIFLKSSGETMQWIEREDASGTGGYRLLTGDTLTINAAVGDIDAEMTWRYRVYFRTTGDESNLSITPGSTYDYKGMPVVCYATEDPYTVYLEFTPQVGNTNSIFATEVYLSPGSSGGGLTVWGVILTEAESNSADRAGKVIEAVAGQTIQAYWTTHPDAFKLEKTSTGNDPGVIGDGEGGAMPNQNLSWQIVLSRAEDTVSAYGKDYVKSVDYTDVLSFPENVSWNEVVKTAIQEGNISRSGTTLFAGDTKILTLSCSGASLRNVSLVWEENEGDESEGRAVLYWSTYNSNQDAEMSTNTLTLTILKEAVSVNIRDFNTETTAYFTNKVEAKVHYHYNDDKLLKAEAQKPISGGQGRIKVSKATNRSGTVYFGEDVTYTLKVSNEGGLPYIGTEGVYTLRDNLSMYTYISPENMEKMFAEYPELIITIANASLAPWSQVTGTDGTEAWCHSGNSNMGTDGYTLTVTYADNQYAVMVTGGESYSAPTAVGALQAAGYAVTADATYTCVWPLNSEDELLKVSGGENRVYYVYATVKDTFQLNGTDWPNEYPSSATASNFVYLYDPSNIRKSSDSRSNKIRREAVIVKRAYKDGALLSSPAANDGDVLEYRLNFTHYGTGTYEDLPMVDDLYGSQYLLVPVVETNSHLAGMATHVDTDGQMYYILTEGSYDDVTVGVDDEGNSLIADTVTVQRAADDTQVDLGGQTMIYSGIHTQIKWYFVDMPGEEYLLTVSYKALVDLELGGVSYAIGNMVWMNDKPGTRIYDPIWGGGTIIEFEKMIVTSEGDTPKNDVVTDYSLVGPGELVTYRITLRNTNDAPYYLSGTNFADALPNNFGVFEWEKGVNVTDIRVKTQGDGITCTNLDAWYIGDSYGTLAGDNQQYILWPDVSSISFTKASTVYLYITLTYPEDAEQDLWSQYAARAGGSQIDNTLFVYRFPSTVMHDLKEVGEVLLQKGVYGMYYYSTESNSLYHSAGRSRYYYNNRDSKYRAIAYYVVLYNGGNKRLYLSDLQDQLPKGFTYIQLAQKGNIESLSTANRADTIVTLGGYNPYGSNPLVEMSSDNVLYRSATITASETETGVKFSISAGAGDYAVLYDEKRDQYYLNAGEAVVFAYICDIGLTKETETVTETGTISDATNIIGMPYTDHLDTGVMTVDDNMLYVTAPDSAYFTDAADGTRQVKPQGELPAFTGSEENWLVSEVTVFRGGIVPGVTKTTVSYTNTQTGVTTPYTNSVDPGKQFVINWNVKLHNSGTLALTDYTFVDIMPKPYIFQGEITVTIYDAWHNVMFSDVLLKLDRTPGEDKVTVYKTNGKSMTITVDAPPVDVGVDRDLKLSITRDEDNNEVLALACLDANLSIPEAGYVVVSLSSCNPTDSVENAVYINRARLIPNAQDFDDVGHGSMIYNGGEPYGAENSSPVTVSYGISTSSEKQVTEKDKQTNTASSMDSGNRTIVLDNENSTFTYSLIVGNDTEEFMKKLVLIDNLSEVGDHSPFNLKVQRSSEFKVRLAPDPNFTVTIIPQDATLESYTLTSDEFTVEFSTSTDFGGPQSPDWKGEATDKWDATAAQARAFRIVILDNTGTKIPAKSSIVVTFDAVADEDADPGEVAWNSFGYHYALEGIGAELEAMPLTVGVMIPSVPVLEKQLLDIQGQPVAAEENEEFTFLIYKGEALKESFATMDALMAALEAENCQYTTVTVAVEAGQTESGPVELAQVPWVWTNGEQYTVVEIASPEDYSFYRFANGSGRSRTFTYDPATTQTIVCENKLNKWSVVLTKTDQDDSPLAGAVFALYSPEGKDELMDIPAEYAHLNVQKTLDLGGTVWYLKDIVTTGSSGMLRWDELLRENYYLLEVKAPDGYNIRTPSRMLYRSDSKNAVYELTVTNYAGFELPQTGGAGTHLYTMGGMLLLAAAVLLYIHILKRRKEEQPSF